VTYYSEESFYRDDDLETEECGACGSYGHSSRGCVTMRQDTTCACAMDDLTGNESACWCGNFKLTDGVWHGPDGYTRSVDA